MTLKFPRPPAARQGTTSPIEDIASPSEDIASPSGSRHSPEKILRMLQNDKGFRDHLPTNIQPSQFCPIDQIDQKTLSLWTASTTGPPRLCCAAGCWSPREPTFEELWLQSNMIKRPGKCIHDGDLEMTH